MEDDGRVLIYEGHNIAKTVNGPHPKRVDQPERNPGGSFTQNGLFGEAARKYKEGIAPPEKVRVYEKIRSGIWVYNGLFELIDCWTELSEGRKVFKFKLRVAGTDEQDHTRIVPAALEDDSAHTKLGEARSMEARIEVRGLNAPGGIEKQPIALRPNRDRTWRTA